ncbi:MAG: 3-dehydroquinate synthase [Streptosporangiaceae bacterium]
MSAPTRIRVGGEAPYDVVVGRGVLDELPDLLGGSPRTVAVVYPGPLRESAEAAWASLADAGYDAYAVEVPDGEPSKDVAVAAHLWSTFGKIGLTRSDAVVGLGGGATTDLAGFTAATWLRGVQVVQCPTTLLGLVDAAVGGKTAINTEEGKNLVGAFHPPAGVLCDLDLLATLPRDDYVSGLAEVVKTGFIADPAILEIVEADPADARVASGPRTRELVERSIRVKADVVSGDLRERATGGKSREILNYGHTLGHAIELAEGYAWRHGAAVAVGMVYVAELAHLAGRLDRETVHRHRTVLGALGLPTTYRRGSWATLREAMSRDKKARGARLRLVVLDGLARPGLLEDPPEELLEAAYDQVSG